MSKAKTSSKVILFTCNWHAYNSLEALAREGLSYSPAVVPIRISCLGRISPGIILKAFEGGAAGVLVLGCPEGHCRYQTGNLEALQVIEETSKLMKVMGLDKNKLAFKLLTADDGKQSLQILEDFLDGLQNGRSKT